MHISVSVTKLDVSGDMPQHNMDQLINRLYLLILSIIYWRTPFKDKNLYLLHSFARERMGGDFCAFLIQKVQQNHFMSKNCSNIPPLEGVPLR